MTQAEREDRTIRRISGAIMVAGAIVIAALGIDFWPWMLVLFALSIMPLAVAQGGRAGGLFGLYWLVALFAISAADVFWPGVLFVAGGSLIVRALVQRLRQ